jgi:hypothetical protein
MRAFYVMIASECDTAQLYLSLIVHHTEHFFFIEKAARIQNQSVRLINFIRFPKEWLLSYRQIEI